MTIGTDIETLARTIYGEARGEGFDGMLAVGWVVKNRMLEDRWPDTIEKVCKQKAQFSCWNTNDPNLIRLSSVGIDDQAFRQCLRASLEVILGANDPTKGANHYLTRGLAEKHPPSWYDKERVVKDIGSHRFLKL